MLILRISDKSYAQSYAQSVAQELTFLFKPVMSRFYDSGKSHHILLLNFEVPDSKIQSKHLKLSELTDEVSDTKSVAQSDTQSDTHTKPDRSRQVTDPTRIFTWNLLFY